MPDNHKEKFKAAIDGIEFDCETLEDSFEKAIARHEYPFRDGADLEDMGQKARVIKIRCYFLNDNYENHKTLINWLAMIDHDYELTHPQYGLVKGQVDSMVVRHDDRLETAEIDLTFVEQMRGVIETVFSPPVDSGTEEAYIAGQDELAQEMESDIREALGADGTTLLEQELDETKTTFLEQYSVIARPVQEYVKKVDVYVAGLKARLNQISNPANGLASSISYATNLPGQVTRALAQMVERYAIGCNSLLAAPDRFLFSFTTGIREIEEAFEDFGKYTRIAKSQQAAVSIGSVFKNDQLNYQAQRQASQVATFGILGKPQKKIEAPDAILTVTEIENALALVRTYIQASVNESRGMTSLKVLATVLTDYVIEIKKTRPPLVSVSIASTMPLHLICLKYGLPYNDAEQLVAINRLRNPSFITGEVQVYAG